MKKSLLWLILFGIILSALSGCAGTGYAAVPPQATVTGAEFKKIADDKLKSMASAVLKNPPDYTKVFDEKPWLWEMAKATVVVEIVWDNGLVWCAQNATGLVVRNGQGRVVILTVKHLTAPPVPGDSCQGTFTDWSKIVLAPSFAILTEGGTTFNRDRVITKESTDSDLTFIGIKLPEGTDSLTNWGEYQAVNFGANPIRQTLHALIHQLSFEYAGARLGLPSDFLVKANETGAVGLHENGFSTALADIDKPIFPGSSGTAFANDSGHVVALGTEIGMKNDTKILYSSVQYLPAEGVALFTELEKELGKMK